MNFMIRQEVECDYKTTEQLIKSAFTAAPESNQDEHNLVSRIRQSNMFVPELSLVAVNNKEDIIGHILLSKIEIINGNTKVESLALAPVSVLPEYQNKGIGKSLIRRAIADAKNFNFQSVIVLGHPNYYPKFGFKKASYWNIITPFEVPDEALMALELYEGSLDDISGTIEYPSIFFE